MAKRKTKAEIQQAKEITQILGELDATVDPMQEDESFGTFASDEERTKYISEKYKELKVVVDEAGDAESRDEFNGDEDITFAFDDERTRLAETLRHYPNDNGLIYIAVYLGEFDNEYSHVVNDFSGFDLAGVIRIYKTRRDAPSFLRDRLKAYLESLRQDLSSPVVNIQSQVDHDYYRFNQVNKFIESSSDCFDYAFKLIKYHYKCELNHESFDSLVYTAPAVFEVEFEDEYEPETEETKAVTWYNRNVLRQGLGKGRENSTFLAKVLATPDTKEVLTVADEVVFGELERDFPNFRDVINFYKAQFRLCALTGRTRISPILLLGPPGVGKTLFSKKLAQVLKTGFTFIDMASASSAWVLSGLHATWHGAKSGKIFDAMLYSPTASPIVVLDELEKPVNPERDPKNALYQLLEENSASEFVDEFVDHPVNLSSIIYIACANGLDGISEPLLTRFKIFDIAPPSAEEQALIIKKMYLDEIEGSNLFTRYLDSAIVDSLLTASLREAKSKISDAVGMALLEHTPAEIHVLRAMSELSILLELRHFKSHHIKTVAKLGF